MEVLSKEWFFAVFFQKLDPSYKIKIIEGEEMFGSLLGVQLESIKIGGYLYFWENGYIATLLIDYIADKPIIDDSLFYTKEEARDTLEKFVSVLSGNKI